MVVIRNPLASSSRATSPSGNWPRLYSTMRFFHFRKSVMLSGSMRISTRRKLASSKFISFWNPASERRFFADAFTRSISRPYTSSSPQLVGSSSVRIRPRGAR